MKGITNMKKEDQIAINDKVKRFYEIFKKDAFNHIPYYDFYWNRLNNCQAYWLEYQGMKILKSYHTIIAIIDENGNAYDFLRLVYGYTATSAQHISKFYKLFGVNRVYQYREC